MISCSRKKRGPTHPAFFTAKTIGGTDPNIFDKQEQTLRLSFCNAKNTIISENIYYARKH